MRVLVCGDDATGRATLVARLTNASDRDRPFIPIRDASGLDWTTIRLATEAMRSDAAIVVVDACVGMTDAARSHAYILIALGLGRIVFAINKMDLVEYAQEVFTRIEQECHRFAAGRGSSTPQPKRQRTHAGNGVVEPESDRLVEQRPRA